MPRANVGRARWCWWIAHDRAQAVNACILFVPALDGKQLLTVEHLAAPDGSLHPVQQAMVDRHGSQCGFCTPGFVMSLYALRVAGEKPDRIAINEALAGNLCRCTGYRPIIDAALDVCTGGGPPEAAALPVAEGSLALSHRGKRSFSPRSGDELARILLDYPQAVIVAGGTDVGLWVTKQHQALPVTVSVDAAADLCGVDETGAMIRIGAAATYQDALPLLEKHFPDFGAIDPAHCVAPDPQQGYDRRQHRQRLADRRLPARVAGVGRIPCPAPRGRSWTVSLDDFFTGYRRTALEPKASSSSASRSAGAPAK